MNIEPTPAEYDSLGAAVLTRARRRSRLRRGVQFAAVGFSAAALAVLVTVNIETFGVEHVDQPMTATNERNPVGYAVTGYAAARRDADTGTLERTSALAAGQLPDRALSLIHI